MAQRRSFERRTINRAEKQQEHLAKHRSALPLPNQPTCLEPTPRSLQLHLFLVAVQQVHLGRIPPNRLEHLPLVGLANKTHLQPVQVAAYLVVHLLLDSHNNNNNCNSQRLPSVGLVSRINNRVPVVVSSVVEHSGRISPQLDSATRGSGAQVSFAVIVTTSANWVDSFSGRCIWFNRCLECLRPTFKPTRRQCNHGCVWSTPAATNSGWHHLWWVW